MTIIRPNDNQVRLFNYAIIALGFLAISFIVIGIGIYGSLVGLQHDIQRTERIIQEEQLSSTKVQNRMYSITDVDYLEKRAIELGLIKETEPEYLNRNSKTEVGVRAKPVTSL